jgi:hypothetical protein
MPILSAVGNPRPSGRGGSQPRYLTPFQLAVKSGYLEAVQFLLENCRPDPCKRLSPAKASFNFARRAMRR